MLVTGAGGSIGSELCRQIARVEPHLIVLLDHAEDNLFSIERELVDERHFPPSMLAAVLADCKEEERMREVFAEHRPTVVFHAAAYKHVALMEANPLEAVRNNAIATRVVATIAGESGVERFVLISTDKAVNPRPSWGRRRRWPSSSRPPPRASRRPASPRSASATCSARPGSVVPIFRRQIERGGPVTVTHEDDPLLHDDPRGRPAGHPLGLAGGGGGRGGVAPDGGTQPRAAGRGRVRPRDGRAGAHRRPRARDDRSVRARPGPRHRHRDRRPRPGEKLHEELFNSYERPQPTEAEKILRAEREPLAVKAVESMFEEITLLVLEGDADSLAAKVSELSAERRETGEERREQPEPGGEAPPESEIDPREAPDGQREAPASLVHSPNS